MKQLDWFENRKPASQIALTFVLWTVYYFLFSIIFNWLTDWFEDRTITGHILHSVWMGFWMTLIFKWGQFRLLFKSKHKKETTEH